LSYITLFLRLVTISLQALFEIRKTITDYTIYDNAMHSHTENKVINPSVNFSLYHSNKA